MYFLAFPAEVILHICSYLDYPELDALAHAAPVLAQLTQDRALHRMRILVVAPARVQHALFAYGGSLRPTVADLVHWGVMRGLGLERRWRMGMYMYSPQSVKQYETSLRLRRTHVRHALTVHLKSSRATTNASKILSRRSLAGARILPDGEAVSSRIDRSLVPVMRKLKWCIRRDKIAQMVRGEDGGATFVADWAGNRVLSWFEGKGRGLWKENERVRLALCPGVRKIVGFYESLSHSVAP